MAKLITLWENYVENPNSENFGNFESAFDEATIKQIKEFKIKKFNSVKPPDEEQYKDNKGKLKSFSNLNKTGMKTVLMEAIKKSPAYTGGSGGDDKPPTGDDKPPTGGKKGGKKGGDGTGLLGGTEQIVAEVYINKNLQDIQKRYDTNKLSKGKLEELTIKLAENYENPPELRRTNDDIFNDVVRGKKNDYTHGIMSGIKKGLGDDDHTKTSNREQNAIDKAMEEVFGKKGGDKPPEPPEPPTGGDDKPPTGGDVGEDPETVKEFVGEQVKKITNGQVSKGFSELNDFLEETDNDDYIYQKLLDAFKGILGNKDARQSHKYASEWYVGVLERKRKGEIVEKATGFNVNEYVKLRNQEKGGGKKGGDESPTGGDDEPPTGGGDEPPTGGGDEPPTGGGDEPPTGGGGKPEVKPPKPVDPLPPIIKASKIKVEDIQTDLDRYREATKKLRNLIKGMNAEGTQQKIPDFEYDTVRYKLLNGKPMSPDEQQHMNEIRDVKKQIEEYEEGAKKIAKEILEKERRSVTATQRTGLLGPHLSNDTTKAVKEQLDKTPEQQIKDISNWYIFDVPSDSTGQGTKIDNPLVAQNEMREKMLLDGATLFTSLSNYTLQEGPFERQDFFHQHPELTKAGIGRGIFEVETEQTKEQFLEKFNDGNNGLFSQDQTREEVSDFQNIYQKPARLIGGADYKLDFTNNRGIKHTDKVWLSNLNLFFDNAPIL